MAALKVMTLPIVFVLLCFFVPWTCGQRKRDYHMDILSDCGSLVNVDDTGVKIHGRSLKAPSNPPNSCIIYLRSTYTRNDGSNKLQIEVDYLNIKDCNIKLDLYNGRKSIGQYMKALSCQQNNVGVIYSKTNEVTVKLTRPDDLYYPEYAFSLTVKPYKDRSVLESEESNEKLSIGAIIGIVIGCLVIVAVLIVVCWFCCSGRISGRFDWKTKKSTPGQVNKAMIEEKYKPPQLTLTDPAIWNTGTGVTSDRFQPRYFQRGVPRNDMRLGDRGGGGYYNRDNDGRQFERRQEEGRDYYHGSNNNNQNRPYRPPDYEMGHNYEPYKEDGGNYKNGDDFNKAKKHPSPRSSPKQQHKQATSPPLPKKETLIDDVFDSDSDNTQMTTSDYDDATMQKRPIPDEDDKSSPKSKRKSSRPIPEEEEDLRRDPQLSRYKSMDLQSQPDTDTMTSPVHINAGVRASVEDDLGGGSPMGSLRKNRNNKGQSKRKGGSGGREPDSRAMPPEAFEPIFNGEPISGINYPTHPQYPGVYGHQMMPQFPGGGAGFMPYGLIPSGAFGAPGVPGSQTYAYAYQTVPQGAGGQPAAQGAWVMHNTPTADGNRRTAYAMEQTAVSPDRSRGKRGNNSSDPFGRTPYRDSGSSSRKPGGGGRGGRDKNGYAPDLSVVTRGAAPPDPGQGHRSVALKSGTDPDTGIHTVQGVWTDTVADPTDPAPGVDNPQITRKTITRVTTKSGYGHLPPENDPLIALEAEPAFLNPSHHPNTSSTTSTPSIMPPPPYADASDYPPTLDFYTGAGSAIDPPQRSSTPTLSTPRAVTLGSGGVIRDRIPLEDSTV